MRCILVLSRNLSYILSNIPTVFGIMCRGHSCEFVIYARLTVINLGIYTKKIGGEGR